MLHSESLRRHRRATLYILNVLNNSIQLMTVSPAPAVRTLSAVLRSERAPSAVIRRARAHTHGHITARHTSSSFPSVLVLCRMRVLEGVVNILPHAKRPRTLILKGPRSKFPFSPIVFRSGFRERRRKFTYEFYGDVSSTFVFLKLFFCREIVSGFCAPM